MNETLLAKFKDWVADRLDRPEPFLANLPACPYAREAVMSGRFRFLEADGALEACLERSVDEFVADGREAVIFLDPDRYSTVEIETAVFAAREAHFEKGVWLLYDDPRVPEIQGDLKFNFEASALIIIQSLPRLVAAGRELEARGYYRNWTPEYYDQVVGERNRYYSRYLERLQVEVPSGPG